MKRALVAVAALALVAARRRPSPRRRRSTPGSTRRIRASATRSATSSRRRSTARSSAAPASSNDVAPFTRLGPTVERRSVSDGVGHITVTETIACLSAACLEGAPGQPSPFRAPASSAGGEVAVAPRVEVTVGSRVSRCGRQGVGAGVPAARRPAEPDVPRLALGRRDRCSRSSASASSPSARSCSRLRCADRAPIGAGRSTSTSASAPSGSCASRQRATPTTAGVRRAWPRGSSASPSWRARAAGVAWSRPEPGPPDATTLADRVEHAAGGRA